MAIILQIILVFLLAGLLLFLAVRAARMRSWVKIPVMILAGLLGVLFLAVGVVAILGWSKITSSPYKHTVSDVQVASSPEQIERGERLAAICSDCHSSTGTVVLDGSKEDFLSDPAAPPVGSIWAPNLTPAGRIGSWSDGEVIRAIREGVDADGKPLVIMPSIAFRHMSDEDVQAVVAYLRSQPAVAREVPEKNLNIVAAVLFGAGMFPSMVQEPITAPVVAPARGTAEYGKYLVSIGGCGDCHGAALDGNGLYGPGVNLTTIVPNWTEEELMTFFRQQIDPKTGRAINPSDMPVQVYSTMFTDEDLSDIFKHLHGLEPVALGE